MTRRIVYIQYTNPAAYPPLEHSSRLLADEGWDVLFLGIRKDNDPQLGWPPHPRVTVHELPPSRRGWHRKLHYARYAMWVFGRVLRWRPGWLYVSDALASPLGLALSFWPGLKVVYHEHDAPQVASSGIARGLVLWTRRCLAKRASGRVLPNERRADHFNRHVANHRPTFSVWNCPTLTEVGSSRQPPEKSGLLALYVGSIVPYRLHTSVIEALALLPDNVHLRVIGYTSPGHPGYVDELMDLARKLGVAHRTLFVDAVPHQRLLTIGREADVGLVLMPAESDDDHAQWMPGASNKPFDYLASGLAVLCADVPGWRELLVDAGYGLGCEPRNSHSIAAALKWFLDHPVETRKMGERGRLRVLADWNYETQFAPVRDFLYANSDSRSRPL